MQDILLFIQQHWMLSSALIIVLIILIILEFIKIKHGATRLNPNKVTQLINHENAVIVDVRSEEAFTNGHIVGAISLPLRDVDSKFKKIEKLKTKPVILVCATGSESLQAANLLANKGFLNVSTLAGGIRAWQAAEMPLVKG